MATQRPLILGPNGSPAELVATDKLGGITGGTASGEVMTQDQFGTNSTEMVPTGEPTFVGVTTGAGGVTVGGLLGAAVLLKAPMGASGQIQLAPNGGTRLLQLSGDFSVDGGFATIIRNTASTDVTLPTSGTLLSSADIGSTLQAYDSDLASVAALSSTGIVARTGSGTAAARTITGTANQVVVSNGDGVSGNPTLSLPQSIDTGASPVFAQVVVRADGGTGISASRYSTNTGGPNFTLQKARGTIASPSDAVAGDVAFNLLAQAYQSGAFRTIANLQARCASGTGSSGSDSPGVWAFQTTPDGSATQRDVVLFDDAGNVQFVVAGTLNAAATDVVSMVGVDVAAADRQLYARTEANQANRLTGLSCRVSSDFSVTSSTTLANVTGLTRNVMAGEVYSFRATLFTTSGSAGGVKVAIGGTCTATSIIAQARAIDGSTMATVGTARVTALATAFCDVTAVTAAMILIEGNVAVNAAGTLTIQFAQNASSGTASVVKAGSYLQLISIGG